MSQSRDWLSTSTDGMTASRDWMSKSRDLLIQSRDRRNDRVARLDEQVPGLFPPASRPARSTGRPDGEIGRSGGRGTDKLSVSVGGAVEDRDGTGSRRDEKRGRAEHVPEEENNYERSA